MAELHPTTLATLHRDEHGDRCEHWGKVLNRFGREVYRQCPDPADDQFEGYHFCSLHMPPGPKAA